jgi:hypothetical protein
MTTENHWHPDLLRRFAATPFIFCNGEGPNQICIQSNDLEIALSIRRSWILHRPPDSFNVLFWKLIRDIPAPADDARISTITDESLRTLYFGARTVLTHDREKAEVFGFISAQVRAEQLISFLLPTLLNPQI